MLEHDICESSKKRTLHREDLILTEHVEKHLEGEDHPQPSVSSVEPSKHSALILDIDEAFLRGDLISARRLINKINPTDLSTDDEALLSIYKRRLKLDPVELYLPIALFIFWIFIFWRATSV